MFLYTIGSPVEAIISGHGNPLVPPEPVAIPPLFAHVYSVGIYPSVPL